MSKAIAFEHTEISKEIFSVSKSLIPTLKCGAFGLFEVKISFINF